MKIEDRINRLLVNEGLLSGIEKFETKKKVKLDSEEKETTKGK